MADLVGPFGTAQWAQAQWYRDAYARAASGVLGPAASIGTGNLALTLNGLSWSIGLGRAHVRGAGYERTGTPVTGTFVTNTTGNPRIDRIVLRRDLGAQTVSVVVIQGTPAASPTPPAYQQNEDGQWDLPLFRVTVPASSGTTLTNITDERRFISTDGGLVLPRCRLTGTRAGIPSAVFSGLGITSGFTLAANVPEDFTQTTDGVVLSRMGLYAVTSLNRLTSGSSVGPSTVTIVGTTDSDIFARLPFADDTVGTATGTFLVTSASQVMRFLTYVTTSGGAQYTRASTIDIVRIGDV